MKSLTIVAIAIPIVNSLITLEQCGGLANKRAYWGNITKDYDKKHPPDIETLHVYIQVEVIEVQNIDVISGSSKVKVVTW